MDIFEAGQVMMRSSYGIIHPNYNSYLNNDIALIRLPSDVTLSSTLKNTYFVDTFNCNVFFKATLKLCVFQDVLMPETHLRILE